MSKSVKASNAPSAFPDRASKYLSVVAAFAAVLVAFGLRAYRIDGQSLWYDEGVSALMAQRDFLTIAVDAAADIHPPLYYFVLHVWSWLAGSSEFALRWLSLIYGVLLVAVVFKLGQRLFDPAIGVMASFLTAFATFPIYYSQEARMYMQVAFLGALSTYLLLRIAPGWNNPSVAGKQRPCQSFAAESCSSASVLRRLFPVPCSLFPIVAYVVASTALLYSHYFAFALVAMQNVWLVAVLAFTSGSIAARLRRLTSWVALQIAIVLSFLPWFFVSLGQLSGWPSISEPMTLDTLFYRVIRVFTFGLSWDAVATPRKEMFLFVLLAAVILAALPRVRERYLALALSALYFVVPVLVMYVLSLQRPMYNPKFLLLAAPGYYLLLAIGLSGLGRAIATIALWILSAANRLLMDLLRRLKSAAMFSVDVAADFNLRRSVLGVFLAMFLLVPTVIWMTRSTQAYYFDPKYARDDYRGLASYIQSRAQSDDAIILDAPGQAEIFGYYFKGAQSIYPLPVDRPMDNQKTEAALKEIAAKHRRIWLVLWAQTEADPTERVERWLDDNSFKAANSWFGGVRLAQYIVAAGGNAVWQESPNLTFGDSIKLKDLQLGSTVARPGEFLDVTLDWQAIKAIAGRYAVFLHVIDAREYLWGQRDSEPGGGKKVTTSWASDEVVEDRHGVPVLPGTPPGSYQLELGMYDPTTGTRLPITDASGKSLGDRFLFGKFEVAKANVTFKPDSLGMQSISSTTFGDEMRLLGFDIQRVGQAGPSVEFRAGDIALITLFWQAAIVPMRDYSKVLEIVDGNDRTVLQSIGRPVEGNYPTTKWVYGELVRDQQRLALSDLAPGTYSLRLGLMDGATGAFVPARSQSALGLDQIELVKFRIK